MSEVAQEVDTSVVTDEAVQNEPQIQDESQNEPETEAEETDEQSPEAEGEEGEGQEPEVTLEEENAKLKKDIERKQKAIDRKTAAYHDMQRAYDKRKQELQALQEQVQAQEPVEEPKIDNYETHEEYVEALAEFRADQKVKQKQQDFIEQQSKMAEVQKNQSRLQKRANEEAEYIKDNPHYQQSADEVDAFLKTFEIRDDVGNAVLDIIYNGNVPQVIDYFGSNNGENLHKLKDISQLTPVEAAVEIYKIQQSLKAPAPKEIKPPPKPVNKPKGGGKPSKDLASGDVLKNLGLK